MKYTASISGQTISPAPDYHFDTITEARKWAESYGTSADRCSVCDKSGREVARHMRLGQSDKWFNACV